MPYSKSILLLVLLSTCLIKYNVCCLHFDLNKTCLWNTVSLAASKLHNISRQLPYYLLYFCQYQFSSNCQKRPFRQYVNLSFQDFQNVNLLPGPFIDHVLVILGCKFMKHFQDSWKGKQGIQYCSYIAAWPIWFHIHVLWVYKLKEGHPTKENLLHYLIHLW